MYDCKEKQILSLKISYQTDAQNPDREQTQRQKSLIRDGDDVCFSPGDVRISGIQAFLWERMSGSL